MTIVSATWPGDTGKANEDNVSVINGMIAVVDGSTSRTDTGCIHGVAWYAEHLGTAITRHPETSPADALAEAITQVANQHRATCNLQHEGTPSAAVAVVNLKNDALHYLILADTTLVIETADTIHVITDNRVDRTAVAEREHATRLPQGSPERAEALIRMKKAELAVRNTDNGFWVAAADPAVVKQAITGEFPLHQIKRFSMLTDGASRAVDKYALYDWKTMLNLLADRGPGELLRHVRDTEASDPEATKWPRNKLSDDATVVFYDLDRRENLAAGR